MDLPKETDDYIKESIDFSLGLSVSTKTLELKLRNSEDDRHRLQDVIFLLEDRLRESQKRVDQYRAEASMNAQGVKRCVEEKEAMAADYESLRAHCTKLEKECMLYEKDFEKITDSYDELAKENDELRARLQDSSSINDLAAELDSLKKDKENLRINLVRAEEEVKVLFEENKLFDEENKRLVKQLNIEKRHRSERKTSTRKPSTSKQSASSSANGKRKSSLDENSPTRRVIDFNASGSPRWPLSPLHLSFSDSIGNSLLPEQISKS